MQVAFHLGVHGTDDERVLRCLAANREALLARGIELSQNAINEPILNEALAALKGGVASREMEDVVLDALVEGERVERLVVTRPTLLGVPRRVFDAEGLLAGAGARMRALAGVLPSAEVEFFLALKNPATLVPDVLTRISKQTPDLLRGLGPADMRWAPAVRRMLGEIGGRRLVLWSNEDTPLIFPELVRRIAGLPADAPLAEDNAVAEAILTAAGRGALAARLAAAPPGDIPARRAATAAVLAEHHDPQAIRAAIAVPGWDQGIVDQMTAAYDADVAEIAALPGVEFIAP